MPANTIREAGRDVYTVSRLNREARALLETGLPSLWITGELSNLSRPASGHWYFSLKDGEAQVRCAMFRQRNLAVRAAVRDGLQVILRARVSLYEARGEFQLVVDHLEEAGEGGLRRQFEALKQKLAAEGLFDSARKRALPRFPRRIGIVTSATGAALRDVLQVLKRRAPSIPLIIYPVPVQGAGAAREIVAMLATARGRAEADLLLLVRGGGSLEDLWAFNDERLARAIADLGIPLISGIGHEVDFTIADFVADLRAPTPSAAAELAVPDTGAWLAAVESIAVRLAASVSRGLRQCALALERNGRRLLSLHPGALVAQRSQRLDELQLRAANAMRRRLATDRDRIARKKAELAAASPASMIAALASRIGQAAVRLAAAERHSFALAQGRFEAAARALSTASPLATLARGYAIVTRAEDGAVVTDAAQAPLGTEIRARLASGALQARVTASR